MRLLNKCYICIFGFQICQNLPPFNVASTSIYVPRCINIPVSHNSQAYNSTVVVTVIYHGCYFNKTNILWTVQSVIRPTQIQCLTTQLKCLNTKTKINKSNKPSSKATQNSLLLSNPFSSWLNMDWTKQTWLGPWDAKVVSRWHNHPVRQTHQTKNYLTSIGSHSLCHVLSIKSHGPQFKILHKLLLLLAVSEYFLLSLACKDQCCRIYQPVSHIKVKLSP